MRILLFLITFVLLIPTNAQEEGNVFGNVYDPAGIPLPYATVLAFSLKDSTLKDGSSTNDSGRFDLSLTKGDYFVRVKFLAYKEYIIPKVTVGSQPIDLGKIYLVPNDSVLAVVDVTVDKPQMELKLDKRVFNIEQDISTSGLNGSEILDNIPSINVDAEGNVSLRGSQNVRILINGKPSTLTGMSNADALRQIDGTMIERVEVITNPSARYDAEGEVGIINIVLKKEMKTGFNGSFNVRVANPWAAGVGFNANYRTKKVNYFMRYNFGTNRNPGYGYTLQSFDSPDTAYSFEQFSEHSRGGYSHNFSGGADIQLNRRNSLTLSSNLRFKDGENWSYIDYYDFDSAGTQIQLVQRDENEFDYGNDIEFAANFRRIYDKPDQLFTFDFKYNSALDNEWSDLLEWSDDATIPGRYQRTTNDENEVNWLFQTDYILPFGKEGKFETGAKVNLRTLNSSYLLEDSLSGNWSVNPLFDNLLVYTENIYAAYVMAGNKTKKFSYQAGLRAEYSDVTTEFVKTNETNRRQYLRFFPSVHLAYELKNNNFLQVSYSRRISRPRHWWLTPFYTFRDSRNFEAGNPNLNPEYGDSYELTHLKYYKKGSWISSVYFRHTTDVMDRILLTDSLGFTFRTPVNLGVRNAVGVEFSGSYKINKWWDVNGSFNFYRAISEGEYLGVVYTNDTYVWDTKFTSRFSIGKKISIQTSFTYESPMSTNQGSAKAQYFWDGSFAWDVLKGKGTVSLNARDILNSRVRRNIVQSEYFYSESEFQWRSRVITLNFVYRINQKKQRNERPDFGGEGDSGM